MKKKMKMKAKEKKEREKEAKKEKVAKRERDKMRMKKKRPRKLRREHRRNKKWLMMKKKKIVINRKLSRWSIVKVNSFSFIRFCIVCTAPPEYCSYIKKDITPCKEWLKASHPVLYQKLYPVVEAKEGAKEGEEGKTEGNQVAK